MQTRRHLMKILHRCVFEFLRLLEKRKYFCTSYCFLFWLVPSVTTQISYVYIVYSQASMELNKDVKLDRLLHCAKRSSQVCADILSEAR